MHRYSLYLFDLDGTLFRGEQPIPGASDALVRLRNAGSSVRFLTNNSGLTREDYVLKLTRLGFEAHLDEIYTSAIGVARNLVERKCQSAFVVGEDGFRRTLQDAGIQLVDEHADAVVVGICKSFTYELLNGALQNCLSGAQLIAANTDATYPVEGGKVIPGAGSLVSAVATASGQTPLVVGKPNPYLVHLILREAGCEPENALVVGDRYETDILAGINAGVPSLLVLTGITQTPINGQWTLPSVADLVQFPSNIEKAPPTK